jgi:hypothetical protein
VPGCWRGALKIEDVMKVVIAAHGAVVPGEFYRTGRRYRRANGRGDSKHKDTNEAKPFHPSLEATCELPMDPARARGQLVKPRA